jgi:hypothetical protein
MDIGGLFLEVVVGVAQHKTKPVLESYVLGTAHRTRKERVCDIGNDHYDHVGLVFAQRSAEEGRLIFEYTNCLANAIPDGLSNRRQTI